MKRLMAQIQALIEELRRRRVIRVGVLYATAAFVILQLGEILVEPFGLGDWALRLVTFFLLGFPLAVGLAWGPRGGGFVRSDGLALQILAGGRKAPSHK